MHIRDRKSESRRLRLAATPAPQRREFARSAAFLTALLALVAAVGLAGCGNETNDAQGAATEGRSVRVESMRLTPSSFEDVIQVTGNDEALDVAVLSAQASGTVVALAPLGTMVSAGQSIAQLDPAIARSAVEQAEAQVESARAQFELAEDNLQRNEPLYRDSVISAVEWENVRAQYNQARANLSQAQASLSQVQEQLRQTRVTAPFTGTVETHFAEIGEQVTPGRQIARVINTNRVKVVAGVPERYAADIALGTRVTVDFRAYAGSNVQSEISFVGRAIDPQSRTFPVEILIPNPNGVFKPEMVAEVFVTRRRIDEALVAPRSAIVRDEDGTSVFLVDESGEHPVAAKTPVVLGPSYGSEVVLANLQPGDEVIVLGQNNLTDGDRVQVMQQHASVDEVDEVVPPEESLPNPEE